MIKRISGGLSILTVALLFSGNASAVPIQCQVEGNLDLTASLDLTTDNNCIVGAAENAAAPNANPASATAVAQTLLDMLFDTVDGFYRTHTLDEYVGSLTTATEDDRFEGFGDDGVDQTITGYEYVLGKYDGINAGYVLFYCGFDCTIRGRSDSLWTNTANNGYALSNITGFNGGIKVPEPGTLGLLGLGLLGVGFARRRV